MKNSFFGKIDKSIFGISAIIAMVFVLWGALIPEQAGKAFGAAMAFFTDNFGWSYMLIVALFLVFCIVVAWSKYGRIKLGKDDDVPEYSTWSWFAMLFSAGMGIGLVFWSVAEPMYHYASPPFGEGNTLGSAGMAMRYVFLHWGLHPWAIYGVVGMALAYFQFRKRLPALISSTLHPLLGDEGIKGPIGKAVDILAVFATLFGVATSLGLGAMQINSGLNYVYNIVESTGATIVIIGVMTVLFIISAVTGINKGIRLLSNINMYLAGIIMLFVLFLGPTRDILNIFTDTMGTYLQNIVQMSFWTDPFGANPGWVGGWTIFYWAWWIAWGPFVGAFIARISKGRTVREFILGVLIAPTLLSFIWLSIMGGTAVSLEVSSAAEIAKAVSENMSTALFAMLHNLPLAGLISTMAMFLIATFFITSADSATFVMGMLTSGGDLEPKTGLKVFWGVTEGAVAAVLLAAGGLGALQTASIVSAFPFMIVMVLMCYSLVKAFNNEQIIIVNEKAIKTESPGVSM
ncbi:MAG: glycine/betaine ABC transporter permease [Clostridiaceae bacterium BRH_c20a]|nr:MAG: glycine/betaine ABC transporter permease [Clostridiaceae bacterium BRH_c20a]